MQIAQELVHGLALGRAARNSRNLGPKAALLGIMHNDFDLHVGLLKEWKYANNGKYAFASAMQVFAVSRDSAPCRSRI